MAGAEGRVHGGGQLSPRRLIVNADDFGLVPSVNRGIVEAIEGGVVTSTSLMVNMPGTEDAVARLRALSRRGLSPSVGLHFNIVAGSPLSHCPTLARSGRFHNLGTLVARSLFGRIDERDVEAELEAQLARAAQLLDPLGLHMTHIDSHRHAHCLPGVLRVVRRIARAHGIGHVRHSVELARTLLRRPRALLAVWLLRIMTRREAPADDIAFAGLALMGSPTFERSLLTLAERLGEGTTELMVHPGYDSPELATLDPYRAPREREVRALTAPALRARLRQLGIELAHF